MENVVLFHTSRDGYSVSQIDEDTLTIGELIEELSRYDEDEKVVFSNDNGYTYGYISKNRISEDCYDKD